MEIYYFSPVVCIRMILGLAVYYVYSLISYQYLLFCYAYNQVIVTLVVRTYTTGLKSYVGEVALVRPVSWHGHFRGLTIQRQSIAPSWQDYKKHNKKSFRGQSR